MLATSMPRTKTEAKTCVCEPCNRTFTSRQALLRHQRENSKHQPRQFANDSALNTCEICSKTFSRPYDLRRHQQQQQHGEAKPSIKVQSPTRPSTETLQSHTKEGTTSTLKRSLPDTHTEADMSTRCRIGTTLDLSRPFGLQNISIRSAGQLTNCKLPRGIPCGICRRTFSPEAGAWQSHMNSHFFEAFRRSFQCVECQIFFQVKADLDQNLARAKKGSCGFMFVHKERCTGHHPPANTGTYCNSGARKRQLLSHNDDDRFDFCYRVRNWELSQLQSHIGHVHYLQNAIDERKVSTEPLGKTNSCLSKTFETVPTFVRYDKKYSVLQDTMLKTPEFDEDVLSQGFKDLVVASESVHAPKCTPRATCPVGHNITNDMHHLPQNSVLAGPTWAGQGPSDFVLEDVLQSTGTWIDSGALASINTGKVTAVPVEPGLGDELIRAVNSGDCQLVKALLDADAPIDHWHLGLQPIHFAVKCGFDDVVQLLLQRNARLNIAPLIAIDLGTERIRCILQNGGEVNCTTPSSHRCCSALHVAVEHDADDLVRLLLQHDANIWHQHLPDWFGETPLSLAISRGNASIIELLLCSAVSKKPDISNFWVKDGLGKALMTAVACNNLFAVRTLLQNGANPNYEAFAGGSPLISAIAVSGPHLISERSLRYALARDHPEPKDFFIPSYWNNDSSWRAVNLEITELLIKSGIDIMQIPNRNELLPMATRLHKFDVLKLIISTSCKCDLDWGLFDANGTEIAIKAAIKTSAREDDWDLVFFYCDLLWFPSVAGGRETHLADIALHRALLASNHGLLRELLRHRSSLNPPNRIIISTAVQSDDAELAFILLESKVEHSMLRQWSLDRLQAGLRARDFPLIWRLASLGIPAPKSKTIAEREAIFAAIRWAWDDGIAFEQSHSYDDSWHSYALRMTMPTTQQSMGYLEWKSA